MTTPDTKESEPSAPKPSRAFPSARRALFGVSVAVVVTAIAWLIYERTPPGQRTETVVLLALTAAILLPSARYFFRRLLGRTAALATVPADPVTTEAEKHLEELSPKEQQIFVPVEQEEVPAVSDPLQDSNSDVVQFPVAFDVALANLERRLEEVIKEVSSLAEKAKTAFDDANAKATAAIETTQQLSSDIVTARTIAYAAQTAASGLEERVIAAEQGAKEANEAAWKTKETAEKAKESASEWKQTALRAEEQARKAMETALAARKIAEEETERARAAREHFEQTFVEVRERIELLLGTREAVLGIRDEETSSSLITAVRPRYLLIARSHAYREKLIEVARSSDLRHVLRHLHELIVMSTRLLFHRLPPVTGRRRLDHWSDLHNRAVQRFLGVTPFLRRIKALPSDASDDAVRESLRGITATEEKFGWACVPTPRLDDPPPIDDATADVQFRNSAAKLLEFAVFPVILLAQELFEGLPREDPSADVPSLYDYERGAFADGGVFRDSIELAVKRASAALGFEYVPIRLYEPVQGRASRFIARTDHQRVPWNEWFGDERSHDGNLIVRFERPAFKIAGTNSLLNDGADVLIGVQSDATRNG